MAHFAVKGLSVSRHWGILLMEIPNLISVFSFEWCSVSQSTARVDILVLFSTPLSILIF